MFTSNRPAPGKRCFTSPVIERVIAEMCGKIVDKELAWLFENCFPNTLDTTVTFSEEGGVEDTFVITGDIDAMWLRDSTNQVWPYVQYAAECPKLRAMLRGLIRRQARCVLLDPYANAFYRTGEKESQWKGDHTTMLPGVHERKYELDSLASVLRLAAGYFEATGDAGAFDETFFASLAKILSTIRNEQAGTAEQVHPHYSFGRTTANATDTLPGGGHGNPVRRSGMSRSPFRPSDDASVFQYHVPSNAMASVMLRRTFEMLEKIQASKLVTGGDEEQVKAHLEALQFKLTGVQMGLALAKDATAGHPIFRAIFAYEVDGFGSRLLMDDANVPNLLSLPYLGYCSGTNATYLNTRKFILSPFNPYYHEGAAASGVGGPHIGMGWIWPLGIITQGITSNDDDEILCCLRTLKKTHAGTGFMHEAFWMHDAARYTRDWFAWANTFFGEFVLHVAQTRPHLLQQEIT